MLDVSGPQYHIDIIIIFSIIWLDRGPYPCRAQKAAGARFLAGYPLYRLRVLTHSRPC